MRDTAAGRGWREAPERRRRRGNGDASVNGILLGHPFTRTRRKLEDLIWRARGAVWMAFARGDAGPIEPAGAARARVWVLTFHDLSRSFQAARGPLKAPAPLKARRLIKEIMEDAKWRRDSRSDTGERPGSGSAPGAVADRRRPGKAFRKSGTPFQRFPGEPRASTLRAPPPDVNAGLSGPWRRGGGGVSLCDVARDCAISPGYAGVD